MLSKVLLVQFIKLQMLFITHYSCMQLCCVRFHYQVLIYKMHLNASGLWKFVLLSTFNLKSLQFSSGPSKVGRGGGKRLNISVKKVLTIRCIPWTAILSECDLSWLSPRTVFFGQNGKIYKASTSVFKSYAQPPLCSAQSPSFCKISP